MLLLPALAAGTVLRLWFLHSHAVVQGDSLFYGDIARNWLAHGIYGRTIECTAGTLVAPTLARLPGYPALIAACFFAFGTGHYTPLLYLQAFLDLGSCLLIAGLVQRVSGRRAAMAALVLAALCPFTANYAAVALTETPSVFCVALGFYSLASFQTTRRRLWLVPLAFSWSYAALLRPDGVLLGAASLAGLLLGSGNRDDGERSSRVRERFVPAVLCVFFATLPFAVWTLRNLHTFHTFQPLVARDASDAGETSTAGFDRWMKTWAIDFTATSEIDWNADNNRLEIDLLPNRAFDSPGEYEATRKLFADYNRGTTLTPPLDARFAALAAEGIARHPLRYYVELPMLRVADMWLRPRVEMLRVPVRWWQYHRHPAAACFALLYGLLNLAYLVMAAIGVVRWPRAAWRMLAAMLLYIVLRCLLLGTLEGPETRYTLECFPVVIALAAVGIAKREGAGRGQDEASRVPEHRRSL